MYVNIAVDAGISKSITKWKLKHYGIKRKCITSIRQHRSFAGHIKAKMKAARDKARLEAYHKQCPCWNSHNDSCYDDNCPCDRDCEYMKSFNLIKYEL